MLRKLIQAAAILSLLTGQAYGQLSGGNTGNSVPMNLAPTEHRRTPEEMQRDREIEAQYNRAVTKIPDKKPSNDPWGSIRSGPAPSASKQQQR
jgi:hypothetical protein